MTTQNDEPKTAYNSKPIALWRLLTLLNRYQVINLSNNRPFFRNINEVKGYIERHSPADTATPAPAPSDTSNGYE